ncbi:MAG: helix-turn-helix transcriptional regulator [Betaproteobacteria bacterium]|nr:helix-turn-helix transcriptional regulator [Betaproteobacteria bacterium]
MYLEDGETHGNVSNCSSADDIAAKTHGNLDCLMCAPSGELFAAQLTHVPFDGSVGIVPDHIIVYHIDGATDVEKKVCGRVQGSRVRVGAVTLVPAHIETSWRIAGPNRVAHLYVSQAQLDAYCADTFGIEHHPELKDFFNVDDPWLRAFFTMLLSERTPGETTGGETESLLLDLVRHRLIRHLIDNFSSIGIPRSQESKGGSASLRSSVLRRILAFVDEHLCGEIRLRQLASIACQSEDHFIRTFRATVGCTPYQYVLNRRIECAKELLRDSQLSINDVCGRAGFNNSQHFSAAFRRTVGESPRAYRHLVGHPREAEGTH